MSATSAAPSIHPETAGFADMRRDISALALKDEGQSVAGLIEAAEPFSKAYPEIYRAASAIVKQLREDKGGSPLEAFLHEYGLETREGVVIMCLAEALLRIPDSDTADKLILDKLRFADFDQHMGGSRSLFVNASTWGLMLTGRVVNMGAEEAEGMKGTLSRMIGRVGEPVIRQALKSAMRIIGGQFVMGQDIREALGNAKKNRKYRYSFDILGEGARTREQADHYFEAYRQAIREIGAASEGMGGLFDRHGISIKLSALHPRYEQTQRARVLGELLPRVKTLALDAMQAGIGVTIDAEEANRLDLSLELVEALLTDRDLKDAEGLGLAVQAYQKRAYAVIGYLAELARANRRRLPVRLVKGAYWDAEIKRAQMLGLEGYPVFTVKPHTDVSYLACALRMLEAGDAFFPQFATHNSLTIAAIRHLAGNRPFEFQRLHGMGERLYDPIVAEGAPCRVYAPVGKHEDLLAYLIRRLLENGANTSFVNLLVDKNLPLEDLLANPLAQAQPFVTSPNPSIPLPGGIYGDRANSAGFELGYVTQYHQLQTALEALAQKTWQAGPVIGGKKRDGEPVAIKAPAQLSVTVGEVVQATPELVEEALSQASSAFGRWQASPVAERAACLRRAADLLEGPHRNAALSLLLREAGKTITDAIAEVREAADFCRYYANSAEGLMAVPERMPGYTGERNELSLHGRGVFVCISPWNFPLAIFTGQVVAALVTGNTVIAKPAEQTPLVAALMVDILHEAGIPGSVLHLLPGTGEVVGAALTSDPRVAGVAFTGSTETARRINLALAQREGPIGVLIAETGGQNTMLVDSTALLEQVSDDVLLSAFGSSGQRCSALRVLYVQAEIADKLIAMLKGAAAELTVGNPADFTHDIGPVIDAEARDVLERHIGRMKGEATFLFSVPLTPGLEAAGHFVAPHAFEIKNISQLEREVFGPVLHIIRYRAEELDQVLQAINRTGYGLTLGINSRIEGFAETIRQRLRVGNAYVNRSMTGAVVGVHPFGGEGLSGTGPKAGGPHYLLRFVTERTFTVNTAAIGGNLELLS